MRTNLQRVLALVVVAGIAFVIGYMLVSTSGGRGEAVRTRGETATAALAEVPRAPAEAPAPAPDERAAAKPEKTASAASDKAKPTAMSPDSAVSTTSRASAAASAAKKPHAAQEGGRATDKTDDAKEAETPKARPLAQANAAPAPAATRKSPGTTPPPSGASPAAQAGATTTAASAAAQARALDEGPAAARPAVGAPRIEFGSADHDFGTVMIGEPVEHEFAFRNVGDATLQIIKVRTSCGCTAALVTKEEVPPGGEGRVKTTFRTTNYKGTQRKSIYVETNDPEQPRVTLRLSGEVKVEVEVSPAMIYARDLVPGESRPYKLVVKRSDGEELRITKVTASRPEIHVGEPEVRDDGSYEVEVTLGPDLPEGRLNGQVTIETDSARQPRVSVRIYANVRKETEG